MSDYDEILEILKFEPTPVKDDSSSTIDVDEAFSSLTMSIDENANELNSNHQYHNNNHNHEEEDKVMERFDDIIKGVVVKDFVENHKVRKLP